MSRFSSSWLVLSLALAACERREPAPVEPPPARELRAEPRALSEPAPALPEPVEVEIPTPDGLRLQGTLYPAPEPDAAAVVLVHQLGSSRGEWTPLIEALRTTPALTVLAFDLRGHGASTLGRDGAQLEHRDFDTLGWAETQRDVSSAVAFLRDEDAPVHPRRVALVGSSIGATAVVRAASEDPGLDVLVALSPGRAYQGVDSILVAVSLGPRALLAIAAREEADSVQTAQALARITGGRAVVVDGRAHGVALLLEHPALAGQLVGFLRESLARPVLSEAAAVPPADPTEGAR
ncbi:MAG: alpha/beta hydrolase [Deltaproteobacteria bacterium]|jgi:alpha-beta hydrolase superfamily lysophospholipase